MVNGKYPSTNRIKNLLFTLALLFNLFFIILFIPSSSAISYKYSNSGSNDIINSYYDYDNYKQTDNSETNKTEINTQIIFSCQNLTKQDYTYILSEDIQDINIDTCINILADNITLDCQDNSIKPASIHYAIKINANNAVVKNCNIESLSLFQGYNGMYADVGIYTTSSSSNALLQNNKITNFYYGIMNEADNSLILGNYFTKNREGIFLEYTNNNIVKENYMANNTYASMVIRGGSRNVLENNKAEEKIANIAVEGYTLNCGYYRGIEFNYYDKNITAIGTKFSDFPINKEFNYLENDCSNLDCFWVGDSCIKDASNNNCLDNDNDGYYGFDAYECYKGQDCNDNNDKINPSQEDICFNDIDEDCSGSARKCKEINSCGNYSESNVDYFLNSDLINIKPMCLFFNSSHTTLDCQNHLITTNKNEALLSNPLILMNGNYNTVSNCLINSNHNVSSYDQKIGYGAITSRGNFARINDNNINGARGAIYINGNYNLVENNKINGSYYGLVAYSGMYNEIKNNLAKNSRIGINANQWITYSNFINNYAYNNYMGIRLEGKDITLKCGKYLNNTGDISIVYYAERIKAIGTIFNTIGSKDNFAYINHSCYDIGCRWFGDECLVDSDFDDVPDLNDTCLNTAFGQEVNENGCSCSQINIPFRDCKKSRCYGENYITYPNDGYDICIAGEIVQEYSCEIISSNYSKDCDPDDDNDGVLDRIDLCDNTVLPENQFRRLGVNRFADIDGDYIFETRENMLRPISNSKYSLNYTKGCSCSQILKLKPGKDLGELMFGCTEGTIKNYDKYVKPKNNKISRI